MITPPRKMAAGDHITAALYNQLLDYVRRSSPVAGANVAIDYTQGGARINAPGVSHATGTLEPFKLAWYGSVLGVYIPSGSILLSGTTVQMDAVEVDGVELDDWYEVADVPTGASVVVVHVKGRTKATGESTIHPAIFVSAHASSVSETDAHRAGDIHSFDIGRAEKSATGGNSVEQLYTGPVNVQLEADSPLELYWKTAAIGSYVPSVKSGTFSLGGTDFSLASDADLTAPFGDVFLIFDCSGTTPVVSISSSVSNLSTARSIRIYALTQAGGLSYDARGTLYSAVYYP